MKSLIVSTVVAAATLVSAQAFASPEADLAKAKGCLACHAVDKKLVGPAYQDIAKKYAGQKDAVAKLAEKVQKGGVGVWGQVPMPENKSVNADEAKKLVEWILAGAK